MGRTLQLSGQAENARHKRLLTVLKKHELPTAGDMAKRMGVHIDTITKVVRTGTITPKLTEKIRGKFPDINMKWVIDGVGEPFRDLAIKETEQMKNDIGQANTIKYKPVPYLLPETIEQNMSIVAEPLMINLEYSSNSNGGTVIINVVNDEMHPVFSRNQRIIIRKLGSKKLIQWGKPYLVHTNENLFCRYVRKHPSHEHKVILRAENKDFDDMDVEIDDILNLYLVIAKDERIDY